MSRLVGIDTLKANPFEVWSEQWLLLASAPETENRGASRGFLSAIRSVS
jgi:hypothetical protein